MGNLSDMSVVGRFTNFIHRQNFNSQLQEADPGFCGGGGAEPPGEAPTYEFAKLSEQTG